MVDSTESATLTDFDDLFDLFFIINENRDSLIVEILLEGFSLIATSSTVGGRVCDVSGTVLCLSVFAFELTEWEAVLFNGRLPSACEVRNAQFSLHEVLLGFVKP